MSVIERDVVLTGREDGEETIDLPVTRLGLIETGEKDAAKEYPEDNDMLPIIDGSDGNEMKKVPWTAIKTALAGGTQDGDGTGGQSAETALKTAEDALTAANEAISTANAAKTSADGKAPASHASTATTYGVSSASNYGHAMASGVAPLANGTAAVGTDNGKFAREGHVHPSDTTRLPLTGGTMTGVMYAQTNTSYTTAQVRNIYATTTDLTAGSSSLTNGSICIVYE